MVNAPTSFDSQHEDIIHDAQFDYYGKRLATCSSDKSIKIFDVKDDAQTLLDTLKGHDGPVWAVAWSHPKWGSLLASAGYDHRVFIWRESQNGSFVKVYEHRKHTASVNSIAWAPYEYGLVLACGSSDGNVSLLSYDDDTQKWEDSVQFAANSIGVNAVAWAPATHAGALFGLAGSTTNANAGGDLSAAATAPMQLATAGCDNTVKLWTLASARGPAPEPASAESLDGHADWVRDVAFAPNVGVPVTYLASCGQDKAVFVWTRAAGDASWTRKSVGQFEEVVWRVSWSIAGDVLAVAAGDNKVTLWRESAGGEWEKVSTLEEYTAAH
ncbi:protein transporter sec-13 [Blastocladiella britannica]|nr:protein transporter sec-13 [Blastocladiella britannica]